ncbi:nucleoporin protein Ndc1-Nup [Amanita rubescens]|nr:nucleoporin protein Ndc1-Nup [Amanita rubescens]
MSNSTSPVRAIRSSLAVRPQPSAPSPQQSYIPLGKLILKQRLVRHVFFYSALVCWIQGYIWTVWILGGVEQLGSSTFVAPFYPLTLLLAGATWLVAALPAIVIRKTYLTTTPTPAASPSSLLKSALSKPSTSRSTATYLLSSILILLLHVIFDGDAKLRLFVKSKFVYFFSSLVYAHSGHRKHPLYLNPRLIYLIFSQAAIALIYTFRNILLDRFVFRFSPSSSPRPLISTFTILHALVICTILATLSTPLTCIAFGLSRFALPLLYRAPLLPYILKPFTAHFIRGSWTLFLPLHHFPLLVRGWSIAYTTLLTWESASLLFELSTSQPITVSHLTADSNVALISGISTSTSPFPFHVFAYLELRNAASSQHPPSTALRSSLFSDQKYAPSLWSHLVRQSLLLLGHDFQALLHRGQPPPPSPASSATQPSDAAKKAGPTTPFPSTPIKFVSTSSSAFKPLGSSTGPTGQQQRPSWATPARAVAECLASDGPLARAVEEGTDEVEEVVGKVPELFRSVLRSSTPAKREGAPLPAAAAAKQNGGDGMGGGVFNNYEWWTRERVHKLVENGVSNKDLDLVVFDMLSHYVCASLTEDQYGVVQRDIPKILEAMIRFLREVDKWRAEILAASSSPASGTAAAANVSPSNSTTTTTTTDSPSRPANADADANANSKSKEDQQAEEERAKANAILTELSDGLRESIGRIVRTFGNKLMAFKFPPVVASGVQGFMDYC